MKEASRPRGGAARIWTLANDAPPLGEEAVDQAPLSLGEWGHNLTSAVDLPATACLLWAVIASSETNPRGILDRLPELTVANGMDRRGGWPSAPRQAAARRHDKDGTYRAALALGESFSTRGQGSLLAQAGATSLGAPRSNRRPRGGTTQGGACTGEDGELGKS